jgi:hypothetical protein
MSKTLREKEVYSSGRRYNQRPLLQSSTTTTSVAISNNVSFNRGLLRGASSLWFGRKYHRLDQESPGAQVSIANSTPTRNTPAKEPSKNQRHIHWNERVRVRRFEKISSDLIEHCYYSESELYSFHREYVMEEEMDANPSSSSDDKEIDQE